MPRVDSKTAIAALAHGRAMLGAGGTGFGLAVRATAYVGCARQRVCAGGWACT